MAQGKAGQPGRRNYTPRPKQYDMQGAKDRLVELVQNGMTIEASLEKVGRTRKAYEAWRRNDKPFAAKVDQARQLRGRKDTVRGERLPFAEWRQKYLHIKSFWHQLQWVDLLENREPRDLHPAQTFEKNNANRILVNVPPFHPAALDTPILTANGWRTVGEVSVGDTAYDHQGRPCRITQTWESEGEVPVYDVELNSGDTIRCDGNHLWAVHDSQGRAAEITTLELMRTLRYSNGKPRWRIPLTGPVSGHLDQQHTERKPLPLDPYLLGYWLGDGDTNGSRIAVSLGDLDPLVKAIGDAGFDCSVREQRGGYSVYIKGLRKVLRDVGVMGHKHIPDEYAAAYEADRLALLQGLMDSDGTVSAKDGRCYFAQNEVLRPDLVRDVYRLVASLGMAPRKRNESKTNTSPGTGLEYWNEQTRIYFKAPGDVPVFRLERKLCKQKVTRQVRTRSVVDVRSAGEQKVRCLTVNAPGNLFLLGDGCIVNHNAKTQTVSVEYAVYRLCMDPSFRILIISAGSELAKSIVYDIQQILTSPDYIELQKAYAPDGGWEATAEVWAAGQITFGADTRASGDQEMHQKDPNVLALGMRSKVYGRRADLIILDDAIDTTNVSEYSKQLKWLRSMVESRLEPRGKLLILGTRVSSIDLYSELMKPENYSNGRVPWTYLASPAILEEGPTPEEHVTLWPRATVPWVRKEDLDAGDSCQCARVECADADEHGEYARWDGLHLELGPKASNNNTDWALIYQQKSVPEDATFPEFKVMKSVNGLRLAGRLENDRAGHPFGGMVGKYVIAGLDPSIKGFAGIVAGAVSRETEKRYLMNAWNLKAPTKDQLVAKMQEITEAYQVNEWRVEKTGLLQFFTQDSAMRQWFNTRGVRFTEHTTGANKWDSGFGISSLGGLFGDYDRAWNDPNGEWREITPPLLELPRPTTDGVKALIHQLITWTPDLDPNKVPQDILMALWFFEVGAREHLGVGRGSNVVAFGRSNRFVSPRARQAATSVRLADYQR